MKHLHKYQRVNLAKKGNEPYWVMRCMNCSHYAPMKTKLSAPMLIGRTAICNNCENPFELFRGALKMVRPVCNRCIGNKIEVKDTNKAERFFEELEEGLKK